MPRTVTLQALRLALGTAAALGLARFAYGLLLPAMRAELSWSLAQAGAMSTANGLGYLAGALAAAAAVRRWGAAAVFRRSMVITALALAATALSDHYPILLATRAVAGTAGAAVFVTGGVMASRLAARAGSGLPITVYFAGAGLGIALSGAVLPPLAAHWRPAWAGLGVAAALAALVSWGAAAGGALEPATGRAVLRPLRGIALAYLLFAAGYITYITFLSAYLAERHAPPGQVMLTWSALGLAAVAAPALTTRWQGAGALAALLGLLAAGAALALVAPAAPYVVVSAIVYGGTFMGVPAAVTALIKNAAPPEAWTATLAAFTTVFAAGQTAGPWLAGLLADRTSTGAILAWTAGLCGAAALIALRTAPGVVRYAEEWRERGGASVSRDG
ncbi:YbfB/YjiJ family MFS transporter [Nonomuraea typhae]|uniref:YbfB/YjiJ family MFS transporter n=1 Tax=Nonomuraea typhae TaxID=2603600 RepID=A0ABW7Z9B6_9ACTN